jgi:hypothetical protein
MNFLPYIINAEYRGDFRIQLTFNDGVREVLDFSQWLDGPIFEPLKHGEYFRRFFVEGGTITWPNGADIAPETLYDAATRNRGPNQRAPIRYGSPSRILTRHRTEKTLTRHTSKPAPARKAESYFQNLTTGREDFWTMVQDNYKRGDISHEELTALVDLGLQRTKGSYKKLADLFHISKGDYRRLMDFLRRNECLLDFRPYRQTT